MSTKSYPVRRCIACRERDAKRELIRVVLVGELLVWDRTHRMTGRGAYIHHGCLEIKQLRATKLWEHALRCLPAKRHRLGEKDRVLESGGPRVKGRTTDEINGAIDSSERKAVQGKISREAVDTLIDELRGLTRE